MRAKISLARNLSVIALALALCLLPVACGDSNELTLSIGAHETAEEAILGQIYVQALEKAGYTVKRKVVQIEYDPAGELASRALKRGRISGYPVHLSGAALTTPAGVDIEDVPADPKKAYRQAQASLKKVGLTAFPPTPFSLTNAVGALRSTAEKRKLKKVSDLEGQSEDLLIAGVTGCHGRVNCVGGLEQRYDLTFRGFIYDFGTETEPFEALETRFSDLAMLPTTDGRLTTEKDKFAVLEEDRNLFPAGNVIFITTPKLVEEAGPEFEEAIVAAQKGLTLAVMQKLDAEVEIEKRDPADVAAGYLRRVESDG